MPFVERRDARVWWDASGPPDAPALLLLMGLGCSSDQWWRVAPALAATHRVIVVDHRGVGRTVGPPGAVVHRIGAMADDAAAVLDAASVDAAHVVGFSMGGMVAQQLALSHPARLRSLTLVGTHCGAVQAQHADNRVVRLLFDRRAHSPSHALAAMQPHVYARATALARIDEDHRVRAAHWPSARGYEAQLLGIMSWSAYFLLPRIRARTLVVHGREDALIPPSNGRVLAQRIPGARLVELDDASHWIWTDRTDAMLGLLREHAA